MALYHSKVPRHVIISEACWGRLSCVLLEKSMEKLEFQLKFNCPIYNSCKQKTIKIMVIGNLIDLNGL